MSSRRTLILIGAVVIGGLAAFLTLSYVRGVETRSEEAGQLVDVVVASGPVPTGTSADEAIQSGAVEMGRRPRSDLPANAVRRLADIGGYVATLDLAGGEVVTTAMFANPKEAGGSNVSNLDEGNVAVTIQVDQASGVAGLVQPGDRINILSRSCVTGGDAQAQDCTISRPQASPGEVTITKPYSYLLQNVKVYAVGTSLGEPVAATKGAGGEADPAAAAAAQEEEQAAAQSGLVTVQLPPDQAALLATFKDAELYLTLNSDGYQPVPVPFFSGLAGLPGESAQPVYPADRGN